MTYTLKITVKNGDSLSWTKQNGKLYPFTNQHNIIFVVKSTEKDRIFSDDFLKQTGLEWNGSHSKPMVIRNSPSEWTVEVIG